MNVVFENSSPQRCFKLKKVKYEILILSSDSRYFWSVARNSWLGNRDKYYYLSMWKFQPGYRELVTQPQL